MVLWKEIHLERDNLQFSVFTSEDIKKLSTVKVVTGLTFDILGRPLSGGLYDPLMGSYGRSQDPCATCFTLTNCPGHFGHIELQSLVFNPFFYKMIHDILKLSCLSCFQMQFSEHVQKIQLLQFELLNAGYILEAKDIALYKSEFTASQAQLKTESGEVLHPKIAEMYELLAKGPNTDVIETRASCAARLEIIHDVLSSLPTSKTCINCQKTMRKVRFLYKKLVVSITKGDKENLSMDSIEQTKGNKVILADECRDYLREVYKNHSKLLQELFPILRTCSNVEYPTDILFMNIIPVTPPKSRPTNVLNNEILEHPHTIVYRNILQSNSVLKLIIENIKQMGENLKDEAKIMYEQAKGKTRYEKIYYAWQELQKEVDILLDSSIEKSRNDIQGLKQVLEKKEGLIRKHMMGKRVNYAARTVITPDPNINVEEVGIPDIFAKKLSYPVPVTPWNIAELRKMVINGPDVHPGANYIEDEKGQKIIIPANNPAKRESYSKLLLTKTANDIKIVHRHLLNGDVLLLNRQPTLHKPSIMAHKARILYGEKTFRLHYSNCKAYNADFDGDEMNAHFPQNEIARSEAYNIVNVANQYLVPKDGTPLGGLIQDHVISGVKLSLRGRFFNREDYQQLVYQGLSHTRGDIKLLPPTILKPYKLWSGKQVLSTVIINIIPKKYPLINLTSEAKVNAKNWLVEPPRGWICGGTPLQNIEMSESEVIIREGELIVGVLDKEQYGATKFGLIHCMYELYGGNCSTQLLSAFTKLFTYFLQKEGFTLGVHDILVTSQADHKRRKIIRECRKIGNDIAATALNLDEVPPLDVLAEKLEEAYVKDSKFRVILDRNYKSVLDKYTNEINQTCLPGGLISKFPHNNLQLMVLSGAKGSMVNTMQISCLLGQIELEGKRPPLMISGKSLPSFAIFETSPKSGGFIDGRFMTGIQPQDFFFHCMAGREGLIDTAVKTSRSGYLQRCLIKHLEGLSVGYDLTVRDSDNSVIQFLYGEDGLDIPKSKFFNQKAIKFLDDNIKVILHKSQLDKIKDDELFTKIQKHKKKIKSWKKKNGNNLLEKKRYSAFKNFSSELRNEIEIDEPKKLNKKTGRLNLDEKITTLWIVADDEKKKIYHKKFSKCLDPSISIYKPDNFYGSISEYLEELMENYVKNYPNRKTEIKDIIYLKSMQAIAQPGEPVGLLAAQSVGEPSTQMTLNTFHFAGRGEMNVTLGIPRLREILMLASSSIKTPSMDIPFKTNQVKNADKLRIKLNRVVLADVLEYVNVKFKLEILPERGYVYKIYFKFLPRDAYSEDFCVKPKQILQYMNKTFFKLMFQAMSISAKSKYTIVDIEDKSEDKGKVNSREDDDIDDNKEQDTSKVVRVADSSDDENENDENDTTAIKLKNRKYDENEYDDPEVEEEIDDANENEFEENDNDINEQENVKDDAENEMLSNLLESNNMIRGYQYDKENYLWCQVTFKLSMKYKNLDMSSILKGLAHKSVVYQVPNIKRAIIYKNDDDLILKTEGINVAKMFNYNKYLDLNRLYSNDIHEIAKIYGIEAAVKVIVKEVQNVFKVYGIDVDPRHLIMIADYMTFDGRFKPLSRKGMENSPSPLQQMSFESSLQFLKSTVFHGRKDDLLSPSSRLMVGLPVKSGTGVFSLQGKIC